MEGRKCKDLEQGFSNFLKWGPTYSQKAEA